MSNLLNLIKINLINILGFNNKKTKNAKGKKIFIAFIFTFIFVMAVAYAYIFAIGLKEIKMFDMLVIMGVITSLFVSIILCVQTLNTTLYASKDNDLLFSLPIKKSHIVISKFISIYLTLLIYQAVILLPFGTMYFIFNGFNFLGFLYFILGMILLPTFPLAIVSIFMSLFNLIFHKFRNKNLFTIIFMFLFFIGFFILYLNIDFEYLLTNGSASDNVINGLTFLPFIKWTILSITKASSLDFLYNFIVSLAFLAISICLCSISFFKLSNSLKNTHVTNKNTNIKSSSVTKSFVKKEFKKLFSTPMYALNSGIGLLILLGGSIYLMFPSSLKLMAGTLFATVPSLCIPVLLGVFIGLIVSLSNTTGVSISLERENLQILKSLPISNNLIIFSKQLFNILLIGPFALFSSIALCAVFGLGFWSYIITILVTILMLLFSTFFGSLCNLLYPKIDATNDTIIIKQSLSSFLTLMIPMLAIILLVVIYSSFLIEFISLAAYLLIALSVILLLTIIMGFVIYKKLNKKLSNI